MECSGVVKKVSVRPNPDGRPNEVLAAKSTWRLTTCQPPSDGRGRLYGELRRFCRQQPVIGAVVNDVAPPAVEANPSP